MFLWGADWYLLFYYFCFITSCQTSRSYLDLENVIGISPQAPQDVARDADVDLVSFVGTDRRQEAIDRCGGRGDNRWGHWISEAEVATVNLTLQTTKESSQQHFLQWKRKVNIFHCPFFLAKQSRGLAISQQSQQTTKRTNQNLKNVKTQEKAGNKCDYLIFNG